MCLNYLDETMIVLTWAEMWDILDLAEFNLGVDITDAEATRLSLPPSDAVFDCTWMKYA